MSTDGKRMYVNKNVPEAADIAGKTVDVDQVLLAHEIPGRKDLETILKVFKEQSGGREPDAAEREVIYNGAHIRSGIPGERAYLEANGIDEAKWNAWCRGIEAKIEKGPFENEPDDADVKPIPHTHNELGATDSALTLAMDRESVRETDEYGHLHVAQSNISKATVNPYIGSEIPNFEELGLNGDEIYQLLRDPTELEKAAPSFNGKPLLLEHRPMDSKNHKHDIVVGAVWNPVFEYPYLKAEMAIWPEEDIKLIENEEKFNISCGYAYVAVMQPGVFEGVPYQGRMTQIRANHVSLVVDGRVPGAVVGDSAENVMWVAVEYAVAELIDA
jgi:hypothetical protein